MRPPAKSSYLWSNLRAHSLHSNTYSFILNNNNNIIKNTDIKIRRVKIYDPTFDEFYNNHKTIIITFLSNIALNKYL